MTELKGLIAEVKNFYAGSHDAPARFLADHDVTYVVWSAREGDDLTAWQAIDGEIGADYRWIEVSPTSGRRVGLWILR
jgi:hypothetical protein